MVLVLLSLFVSACVGTLPLAPDADVLDESERESYAAAMRALIEADPASALAEIEALTAREPWYVPAHVLNQDALAAQGNSERAQEFYTSQAKLHDVDAARVLLAGRVARRDEGVREAAYRRAVDLDPVSPWPTVALVYELARVARTAAAAAVRFADDGYPARAADEEARASRAHGEADRLVSDLLRGHPSLADAHGVAAEVEMSHGGRESVRNALEHAERATELDPGLPRWFALLARVRRELIDDTGAERALLQALELAPDDPDLLASLGRVLLDLGRPTDARDALLTARAGRPNDAVIATDLGVAHHRSGEFRDAVRQLEHATRLDTQDPRAVEALALVYLDAGNREAASAAVDEYLARGGASRASAERILRELGGGASGGDAGAPPR